MTTDTEKEAPTGFTSKQMGDACEMLVAAELTLAGVPAAKAPDYWPGYDVFAQPIGQPPQRISVKSRTFKRGSAYVRYSSTDVFDWLAVVILPAGDQQARRIFVIPRAVADRHKRFYRTEKMAEVMDIRVEDVAKLFPEFENNFRLKSD